MAAKLAPKGKASKEFFFEKKAPPGNQKTFVLLGYSPSTARALDYQKFFGYFFSKK
jgi:hypothetical protein